MHNVLRVAIYIRVSSKLQEGNYSLSAQTHELTKYANAQGWEIVDIYKDADSGTKLEKDGLEAMLDAVEEGLVDVVLCIEQDRLSRLDTVKWEYLKSVLKDNQVKIAEPGSIVDLTNIDDEFVSDIKNLVAQRSRKDMLRKMARGRRQSTREGKIWGKQPEEYNHNKLTDEVTINEKRGWIIPFIDKLYVHERLSTQEISDRLNNISTSAGGGKWTAQAVYLKLIRKAYHGEYIKRFENGETIITPDRYPPLRTIEMYEKIKIIREENYRKRPAESHFLRNVKITCGACGKIVQVNKTVGHNKDKTSKYESFILRHSNRDTHKKCPAAPRIDDKRLRSPIANAVKEMLSDDNAVRRYIDTDFDEGKMKSLQSEIKNTEKLMKSKKEEMDRILVLYIGGEWPKETLDAEKRRVEKEINTLQQDLKLIQNKYELIASSQINIDTIKEFMTIAHRFDELLEEDEQQLLMGSVFPKATLHEDILTLHALLPQQIIIDVNIAIEPMDEVMERIRKERAYERYKNAQAYLNQNKGTSIVALCQAVGSQHQTLKKDQEEFGPFEHLGSNRLSSEEIERRVEGIKKELTNTPGISQREIAERLGLNPSAVNKLIKEHEIKV